MIIEFIKQHAAHDAGRPALIWNGRPLGYGAFSRAVELLRRKLSGQGLLPGSTAVVAIAALPDAWVAVLALRSLGVDTVCVVDVQQAQSLGLTKVSCVVGDELKLDRLQDTSLPWPGARLIRLEVLTNPSPVAPAAADAPETDTTPGYGGHVLYTSGTTGKYKKVYADAAEEVARSRARAGSYGLDRNSRWFIGNLGLWTAVGYKMPLALWLVGGCVVLDQRRDWAEAFLDAEGHDAMLLPDMASELLQAWRRRRPALPKGSWQLTVTAGFLPPDVAQGILSGMTNRLAISYGATELCRPALRAQVDHLEDMHWFVPEQDREIEVIDDAGQVCPVGVEGELRIRLEAPDSRSYVDDVDTSARVFRGGWFHPGDMAVRRLDGRVRVLGRSADVLNLRGRKISVAPIEQAIQVHLGASAVCAFSGLREDGTDELVVAVESAQEFRLQRVDELLHGALGQNEVRYVMLEAFPRTLTGTRKVDRRALRQHLFPQDDAQPVSGTDP